jgi:hypothetical protein
MHLIFIMLLMLITSQPCLAQEDSEPDANEAKNGWEVEDWYVFTSIYTKHFDPDPEHVNNQKMLGVELQMHNNWVFGVAAFDNSFGQNSQYLYGGKMWSVFGSELFYWKLTGGLLHGYKEPYEDKIPLNGLGIAPAIVPTIGLRYKFLVTELNFAGLAAINITAGFAF